MGFESQYDEPLEYGSTRILSAFQDRATVVDTVDFIEAYLNGTWAIALDTWDGCTNAPTECDPHGMLTVTGNDLYQVLQYTDKNSKVAYLTALDGELISWLYPLSESTVQGDGKVKVATLLDKGLTIENGAEVYTADTVDEFFGQALLPIYEYPTQDGETDDDVIHGLKFNGKGVLITDEAPTYRKVRRNWRRHSEAIEAGTNLNSLFIADPTNQGNYLYLNGVDWRKAEAIEDMTNIPAELEGQVYVVNETADKYGKQTIIKPSTGELWYRSKLENGTFTEWVKMGMPTNIPQSSVIDLVADLLDLANRMFSVEETNFLQDQNINNNTTQINYLAQINNAQDLNITALFSSLNALSIAQNLLASKAQFDGGQLGSSLVKLSENNQDFAFKRTHGARLTSYAIPQAKVGEAFGFNIPASAIILPEFVWSPLQIEFIGFADDWVQYNWTLNGGITLWGTPAEEGKSTVYAILNCNGYVSTYPMLIQAVDDISAASSLSVVINDYYPPEIALSWGYNGTTPDGFYIYRRANGGGWDQVNSVGGTTYTFTDTSANYDTLYDYQVKPYTGGTIGGGSNIVTVQTRPALTLGGLYGRYYLGTSLSGSPIEPRIDEQINFNWSGVEPISGLGTQNYSVRWTGYLKFPYGGLVKFRTRSDDGIRVWVDSVSVVDEWREYSVFVGIWQWTTTLVANEEKPITIEYFQGGGDAAVYLEYETSSGVWEVVPSGYLVAEDVVGESLVAPVLVAAAPISASAVRLDYTYAGLGDGGGDCSETMDAGLVSALDSFVSTNISTYGGKFLGTIYRKEELWSNVTGADTRDTKLNVASLSKQFAATVILKLIDEGLLALTTTTGSLIPSMAANGKGAITVKQLMSHTSGMKATSTQGYEDQSGITMAQAVDLIAANVPLEHTPGTYYEYGGVHWCIVARMAEIVTGQSWVQICETRILTPLGMTNTDYLLGLPGEATPTNPMIHAGLRTTLNDWAKYMQMHLFKGVFGSTRIMSESRILEMEIEQTGLGIGYGFGLYIDANSEFFHYGATGCGCWINREKEYYGIILTTVYGGGTTTPNDTFRGLVRADIGAAPVCTPSGDLDSFTLARSLTGNGNWTEETFTTSARTRDITGLAAGTLYYWRMLATFQGRSSGWSNIISATTNTDTVVVPAPTANARAIGWMSPNFDYANIELSNDIITRAKAAGVAFATIFINWWELEQAENSYNFGELRWRIEEQKRKGLGFVLVLPHRFAYVPKDNNPSWQMLAYANNQHRWNGSTWTTTEFSAASCAYLSYQEAIVCRDGGYMLDDITGAQGSYRSVAFTTAQNRLAAKVLDFIYSTSDYASICYGVMYADGGSTETGFATKDRSTKFAGGQRTETYAFQDGDWSENQKTRFTTWLQTKYVGVANLNAAWNTTYPFFGAIQAAHYMPPQYDTSGDMGVVAYNQNNRTWDWFLFNVSEKKAKYSQIIGAIRNPSSVVGGLINPSTPMPTIAYLTESLTTAQGYTWAAAAVEMLQGFDQVWSSTGSNEGAVGTDSHFKSFGFRASVLRGTTPSKVFAQEIDTDKYLYSDGGRVGPSKTMAAIFAQGATYFICTFFRTTAEWDEANYLSEDGQTRSFKDDMALGYVNHVLGKSRTLPGVSQTIAYNYNHIKVNVANPNNVVSDWVSLTNPTAAGLSNTYVDVRMEIGNS